MPFRALPVLLSDGKSVRPAPYAVALAVRNHQSTTAFSMLNWCQFFWAQFRDWQSIAAADGVSEVRTSVPNLDLGCDANRTERRELRLRQKDGGRKMEILWDWRRLPHLHSVTATPLRRGI